MKYSKFIVTNIGFKLFELVAHAIKDGVNVQTYRKRATILLDINTKNHEGKLKEFPINHFNLDCACTANYIFQKLFINHASFKEHRKCLNCNNEKTQEKITITANLPTCDLKFLMDILEELYSEKNKKCENCDCFAIKCEYTFGSHVFIELCAPLSDHQKVTDNLDISLILSSIPKKINLNEKQFTFRGAISFIPPLSMNKHAIGHYVSYCWREHTNIWERYDDLQKTSRVARPNTILTNCQFLVYTE